MKKDYTSKTAFHPGSEKYKLEVACTPYVIEDLQELEERRIYLSGEICSIDSEEQVLEEKMTVAMAVRLIMKYNREDKANNITIEDRKPIKIYINSPGGEIYEGFSLVTAIELSETPVYTYNIGQWSSMAFLIGITGHKRFSMPNMVFLMHDGSNFVYGSTSKVQDTAKFHEKYENKVIKAHILKHSSMTEEQYEKLSRVEYYMLPDDALVLGFIDKIAVCVSDIL